MILGDPGVAAAVVLILEGRVVAAAQVTVGVGAEGWIIFQTVLSLEYSFCWVILSYKMYELG